MPNDYDIEIYLDHIYPVVFGMFWVWTWMSTGRRNQWHILAHQPPPSRFLVFSSYFWDVVQGRLTYNLSKTINVMTNMAEKHHFSPWWHRMKNHETYRRIMENRPEIERRKPLLLRGIARRCCFKPGRFFHWISLLASVATPSQMGRVS